jgi:hypothetical protein
MASQPNDEQKLKIALEIYKDISRQILFADTKAVVILAWHGASLGFLFKIVSDNFPKLSSFVGKVFALTSFGCGLISALLSLGFAFWVVIPRLKDTSCRRECMFWAYHISCEGFERDVLRFKENIANPERVLDCLSRSVVAVAQVLKEKYEKTRKSLLFLLPALAFEILTILLLLVFS